MFSGYRTFFCELLIPLIDELNSFIRPEVHIMLCKRNAGNSVPYCQVADNTGRYQFLHVLKQSFKILELG